MALLEAKLELLLQNRALQVTFVSLRKWSEVRMGFSFRKSVKLGGGLRLNFSRKGIGLSGGVKGARISVGPRGTNFYGGIGPLRYQTKLGGGRTIAAKSSAERGIVDPFALKRPSNYHAWITFMLLWPLVIYVANYTPNTNYFAYSFLGWIVLWLWTFFNGPKNLKAYRKFRDIDFTAGTKEERAKLMQGLLADYPNDFFCVEFARIYQKDGNLEEAEFILEHLTKKHNLTIFHAALGEARYNLKKYDKAIESFSYCDEAEEFDDFFIVLKLKTKCFIAKREFDRALEATDEGLRKRGERHTEGKRALRILKGQIYLEMGDSKKARKEIEKLLTEVPDLQEAKDLLVKIGAA